MITQGILDFLSTWLAGIIDLFPPLPAEASEALGFIEGGVDTIVSSAEPLGIIVPFDAMMVVAGAWVACLAFWAVALAVKAVLWALGR